MCEWRAVNYGRRMGGYGLRIGGYGQRIGGYGPRMGCYGLRIGYVQGGMSWPGMTCLRKKIQDLECTSEGLEGGSVSVRDSEVQRSPPSCTCVDRAFSTVTRPYPDSTCTCEQTRRLGKRYPRLSEYLCKATRLICLWHCHFVASRYVGGRGSAKM
jgi:hypothetical protein